MPEFSILLFDIDGTLLSTGGAGRHALEQAFLELAGVEAALAGVILDGATDQAIVSEILVARGQPAEPTVIAAVLDRYAELLPAALATAPRFAVLPGVGPLLTQLSAAGRSVGLCTGNIRAGAETKLRRADLWSHFATGFGGGFGCDAYLRADIVRAALGRAAAHHGAEVPPQRALVIGDTPRDVEAALAAGVPVLAVASGRHGAQALRDSRATYVVESLESELARQLLEVA